MRNEPIRTRPVSRETLPKSGVAHNAPRSGLYLIQFVERLDPARRAILEGKGVHLLQYVPDDAFVAQLQGATLEEIQADPFVQWVGEYKPEHKTHKSLALPAPGLNGVENASVTVLLTRHAAPAEWAEARKSMERLETENDYRFGTVWRGRLAPGRLRQLAESAAVLWIEPSVEIQLMDEVSSKIVAGSGPDHATYTQSLNFDGEGIRVAVADTGLQSGSPVGTHPDLAGRAVAFFQYGNLVNAADQHGHGTHLAGIIAGNNYLEGADSDGNYFGLGIAPAAEIVTQRIFDGAGIFKATNFATLTRDAVLAGAYVGNNSWGADVQGRYDVNAWEFDSLVRDANLQTPQDDPYVLIFSAGNSGPRAQAISSPGAAKNVITVGASQSSRAGFTTHNRGPDAMASFSSRGPCEDGRTKPDLVAPGTWIASLWALQGNPANIRFPIDEDYVYMEGTSQAAAHVSGAAAVFVQYYQETITELPSPAMVKAALIHAAVDMDNASGTPAAPNMEEGWGRLDLRQIIGSLRTIEYLDQVHPLTHGQTHIQSVIVATTNFPLKITLAYTDVPGFPGAIPSLVNDLDLEVVGPDGRTYRGNQFEAGESVAAASASDNINNVEGVLIAAPSVGQYQVRVRARTVAVDARDDVPGVNQDFALVISGDIPPPENGALLLDRNFYTAPSRIQIKLFDIDLIASNRVTIEVRSATESASQPVVLFPLNSSGVFTGSVATASGPAANDGRLQIAHGDWISVQYFDESQPAMITNLARADLNAPVITSVFVTNRFGRTLVSWRTDEPSSSVVRFGLDGGLNSGATNEAQQTVHEVELIGLSSDTTYFYSVISSDAAGNTSTNQTGVSSYQFVAQANVPVLLVDAYIHVSGDLVIPRTTFTDSLDQIGVNYDVWDYLARGSLPVLNDLRSYQVVIWRINDSINSSDTIPFTQQTAIQQYLNSGGSLFLASMEALSRILDQGGDAFVRDVLHVQRFDRGNAGEYCLSCDENFRVPVAQGVIDDVLGTGLWAELNYSAYPTHPFSGIGPDLGDTFGPATNAAPFLLESSSQKTCGLRYPREGEEGSGRVVFLSFPLDAVPENGVSPNTRSDLLRRTLQFLSPGIGGAGHVGFSKSSYRLPDLLTLEVGDSDLAGSGSVNVLVHSDTANSPLTIVLSETPRRGHFRGSIPLVSAANSTVAGRLRAAAGDALWAEYYDQSAQSWRETIAFVDASPPEISSIQVQAHFQDAQIRWNTTEPTDALVQFGESALLGNTAYVGDLKTSNSVTLNGLSPETTYFYKLVSRDLAGNAAVSDNGGQLFTFQTRPALSAPLLEGANPGGVDDWRVVNSSDTDSRWRAGLPFNNFISESPTGPGNVWGSNLTGTPAKHMETTLVSPAIRLSGGGNIATLRFWQAYDFTKFGGADLINRGQLLISTNAATSPVVLAEYQGTTPPSPTPWQEQEFDLSPYLGQVVFLLWRHQLVSLQPRPRPGWALDDISITVSNLAPGLIQVANNLAQATVSVSGRVTRAGRGLTNDFPEVPPGRYVATWSPVPFYETPTPQTNVLAPESILIFNGVYTFPDGNFNNMSDAWELAFFNELSFDRDCLTDTDADGFNDCEEFAAGTNPTLPGSVLKLRPPVLRLGTNGIPRLVFEWRAVPGRLYELQGTREFTSWIPLSFRLQASTTNLSTSITLPEEFDPNSFRLQVWP